MAIHDLPPSYFLPDELATTARRILAICLELLLSEAGIQKLIQHVGKDADLVEAIINRSRVGEFTEILSNMDIFRDNLYRAIDYFSLAWSFRDDSPSESASAGIVVEVLQRKGLEILSYGYSRESAEMNAVIKELELPAIATHLNAIGGGSWLAALKTAQNSFERTYLTKVNTETDEERIALKTAFAGLSQSLTGLVNMVDLTSRDGEAHVMTAVDRINKVIDEMMAIIRARRTRKGKPPEQSGPPT
jgi:hypothetical protein